MKDLLRNEIQTISISILPLLLTILFSPLSINAQDGEASKTEVMNQHTSVLQNILNLNEEQLSKYVHPFWYEYEVLDKKSEVHNLCPHFPLPVINDLGMVQNDISSMQLWMESFPDELKEMENIFHPNIIFRKEHMIKPNND